MAAISQWQLNLFSSMLLITAFDFEDTETHVPATTRDCSNKVSVFNPTNIFFLCAYGETAPKEISSPNTHTGLRNRAAKFVFVSCQQNLSVMAK